MLFIFTLMCASELYGHKSLSYSQNTCNFVINGLFLMKKVYKTRVVWYKTAAFGIWISWYYVGYSH